MATLDQRHELGVFAVGVVVVGQEVRVRPAGQDLPVERLDCEAGRWTASLGRRLEFNVQDGEDVVNGAHEGSTHDVSSPVNRTPRVTSSSASSSPARVSKYAASLSDSTPHTPLDS